MRATRYFQFARHIPLQQIMRRIFLISKRRIRGILNLSSSTSPYDIPPDPPELMMIDSSNCCLKRTESGWHARFLGETRHLGEDIPFQTNGNQVRDQLWQMNLHYFEFLQDMSWDTGSQVIADWIDKSKPHLPNSSFAAWAPYAISIRLSAWLRFWNKHHINASKEFAGRFSASVREQAAYLAANLETDVRGNHIIKNLRALMEVGVSYSDQQAVRWRKLADSHLALEIEEQILPDGMHFERSLSYHIQVFCDLMSIEKIRPHDAFSERLQSTIRNMAPAIRDLQHPDGLPVQFNDSGLHMSLCPEKALSAFRKMQPDFCLEPVSIVKLEHAGFYAWRGQTLFFAAKLGKLGPDALMAHAHGDWGSFELSYAGHRLFVDQGVFEYFEGADRILSRSTAAHNTAMINNTEQADFFGSFRCGSRPSRMTAKADITESGGQLSACLDLHHMNPDYKISRTFEISDGRIAIADTTGPGEHKLVSRLLLHPDIEVEVEDQCVRLRTPRGQTALLSLSEGTDLTVEDACWWPDMGVSHNTQRVVIKGINRLLIAIEF